MSTETTVKPRFQRKMEYTPPIAAAVNEASRKAGMLNDKEARFKLGAYFKGAISKTSDGQYADLNALIMDNPGDDAEKLNYQLEILEIVLTDIEGLTAEQVKEIAKGGEQKPEPKPKATPAPKKPEPKPKPEPKAEPEPKPEPESESSDSGEVDPMSLIRQAADLMAKRNQVKGGVDREEVGKIVKDLLKEMKLESLPSHTERHFSAISEAFSEVNQQLAELAKPREIVVTQLEAEPKNIGVQHFMFPVVLKWVQAGVPVFLTGPAGSAKTSVVKAISEALSIPFHPQSFCAHSTKSDLFGFIDAGGTYRESPLYRAYKQGGIFLGDEFDAGNPSVSLAINSSISNGFCAFPEGLVEHHESFRCVVTGNTVNGATDQYVGRNKPDAATLDRFAVVNLGYDESLEASFIGIQKKQVELKLDQGGTVDAQSWNKLVCQYRQKVKDQGMNHIISPRATVNGWKGLKAGLGLDYVVNAIIRKGLSDELWNRIK